MKSVIVTKFGGPEVLEIQDVPVPEPAPNQVLIKVKAAGINYADIMQRNGMYLNGPKPPFGAGFEVSGVVEKLGADVTDWRIGDSVIGFCASGYSEYVVADATAILEKPVALDFNQAAAIPCQYFTAYHVLLTLGRLRPEQTVLIHAAAGGLGTLMVQIARNVGATVIGTCGTEEKCALIRELGCDHPVNYVEQDFYEEVKRITDGAGCNLIVETVGGKVFDRSMHCLRTRGHLIVVGIASAEPRTVQTLNMLFNSITVSGFHLFAYVNDANAMRNAVSDLEAWLEAGKFTVVMEYDFPLEKAAEAHQFISDRQSSGKVVLSLAE